jgi:alpha-tubulin suppressor-like RCC1 family protein
MRRARLSAVALTAAWIAVIACNQILGVDDVTLKDPKHVGGADGGGSGDDDDSTSGSVVPGKDGSTTRPDRGQLSLGFNHGCARLPSGGVRCWGDNLAGELGDGIPFVDDRPDEALKPQDVPGMTDVVDIASGLAHTCIVHTTGKVSCWGVNSFGQLGNNTKERSSAPVDVIGLSDATSLGGGESFMCAVKKDQTVVCWGANYSGQLGDGTKDDHGTPAPVKELTNVSSMTAARDHACAVVGAGDVMCWGGNATGQLGIGSTNESLKPTKLTALSKIAQVAAAARFTCAREESGRVFCWGANDFGQLGNGSPNADPNPAPIIVGAISDAVFLWTGFDHACAVRKTGAVACWGKADSGQLGAGPAAGAFAATPVAVTGLPGPARGVWSGGDRSCAIEEDGHGFCWGQNTLGQLGSGTTDKSFTAVPLLNFP